MDAFYVSVELQRRPELRGLPVVVAGSGPRAVVTTASYEARKHGVFSATPASRARRLCPDAVFVAPDFDHYRARSRAVMEVLRGEVDTVEVVGLDEAYLDLGGPGAAQRRGAQDQGGGHRAHRPGLLDRYRPEQARGQGGLRRRQARRLPRPHGGGRAGALRRPVAAAAAGNRAAHGGAARGPAGSRRWGRWRPFPRRRSRRGSAAASGPTWGAWPDSRTSVRWTRRGCASRSRARPRSTPTCAGSSSCCRRSTAWRRSWRDDLARNGRSGRTVGIKVRLDDFSTHTRARTLDRQVTEAHTLRAVAAELLRALDPGRPVRLLGVRVAGMEQGPGAEGEPEEIPQLTLSSLAQLARRPDRAGRAEPELGLGGRCEVPLATADVGAAIDHAHGHRPAAVAERDPRAARQRLVRHSERALGQPSAAAQRVAVQARGRTTTRGRAR